MPRICTSFCLDNGDHCLFGTNQDNTVDRGLVVVKARHVLKTAWDPSTSGKYARWISRYGSVTFDYAGYQLAWAGMNEAGLMISTMALNETRTPSPDERPPLLSPFWMQYQLDNHSTVEEVIASHGQVRIVDGVDHYLVCDRKGDCATIEFLEGKMVCHMGESLPVAALANSAYEESVRTWESGEPWGVKVHWVKPDSTAAKAGIEAGDTIIAVDGVELEPDQPLLEILSSVLSSHEIGDEVPVTLRRSGDQETATVPVRVDSRITEEGKEVLSLGGGLALGSTTSPRRFAAAADRLLAFEPSSSQEAVAYALETLQAVAQQSTAWSIVFDPASLRIYFRTNRNTQVRYVDFSKLDFSCNAPIRMLDIHAELSGDISRAFQEYSHKASIDHTLNWMQERGQQDYMPPSMAEALLWGVESFPCRDGIASVDDESGVLMEDYAPRVPPTVGWAALAILHRYWPVWLALTLLSLAVAIWHLARGAWVPWGKRLLWSLVVLVFGPFGLLVFLLIPRRRRRVASGTDEETKEPAL